jgi:hypothetical protein
MSVSWPIQFSFGVFGEPTALFMKQRGHVDVAQAPSFQTTEGFEYGVEYVSLEVEFQARTLSGQKILQNASNGKTWLQITG